MDTALKGENRIGKFRRVAESLTSKIASCEGVIGVVWIGGLVRGFADRFSDVDVIAFLARRDKSLGRKIYKIGLEEEKSGADIDLEAHFFGDFKKWKWSEADRWEFSKAKIVFDPNGEIKRVFEEKLRLPKEFWVRRIVIYSEYMKWYCCPPRKDIGTISESWIERGDLASAHYCLNYSVELLLRLMFALNKEFLPAPKWRLFYSYQLKWLPENYRKLAEQAMSFKDFSTKELERRLEAIRELWLETLPRIKDETGFSPEQISEYFVQRILHQTWIPTSRST